MWEGFPNLNLKREFQGGMGTSQAPGRIRPERLRRSKQSGWGANRALPLGLVKVVCLKLVPVWPVGKRELQSLGLTLSLLISGSRARSVVYFKSGETMGPGLPGDRTSILMTGTGWKPQLGGRSSPGLIFHPK